MKVKICTKCKRKLPETEEYFFRKSSSKHSFRSTCKECSGKHFTQKSKQEGYKICKKCHKELPATVEYFQKSKVLKDGLIGTCRECTGVKYRVKNVAKEGYKVCNKCHKELPANNEFFHKNRSSKDGLNSICIKCKKEYCFDNKDKINNYVKKYRKENYEKCLQRQRLRMKTQKYKLQAKEWTKRLYQKNKVKRAIQWQNRRAEGMGASGKITLQQWDDCLKYFDYKCAYCGKSKKLSIDHIIPLTKNGINSLSNIVPSCKSCNSSKSNHNYENWYKSKEFYAEEKNIIIKKWVETCLH